MGKAGVDDGDFLMLYAHSKNKAGKLHPVSYHLESVARIINDFYLKMPWHEEAVLAGQLHDLGKYGDLFQERLRGKVKGIDHWSMGAWLAVTEYKSAAAALAIQGHHIGLQYLNVGYLRDIDPTKLATNHPLQLRLSEADLNILKSRLNADELQVQSPRRTVFGNNLDSGIDRMLDVRMLFSALVDADFLDTEAHFNGDSEGKRYRQRGPELQAKRSLEILLEHIERVQAKSNAPQNVIKVRESLLQSCLQAAKKETGLFTLTAPTGSGKTLAMLAFALKHALRRKLRRVIVVIPYLSIIEQTAEIYCNIFSPHFDDNYVLEHHSLAGLGYETNKEDNEGNMNEELSSERQRRLLSENWDAPLIVTTSVQMLESLFSNRSSACRKLHRLARSVILFDEVQTLPAGLAVPTLAALSHFAHTYGSSVVFSTATQPAFTHLHDSIKSHCTQGWQPKDIVSETVSLFIPMRRTRVIWDDPDKGSSWDELTSRIQKHSQVLCIVNLKKHAKELWEKVGDDAFHLSTNLCPVHRRNVLDEVRVRLEKNQPVHLIATQCVEAGVDVDFPVVYRAYAPMDAIIQAAGRCNRHGKNSIPGNVHIFMPEDESYPGGDYKQAALITKMLLKLYGADNMNLDNPEFIKGYYKKLYDISKPETAERTKNILESVKAGSFPDIAKEYRLIKQNAISVLVPYQPLMDEFLYLKDEADKKGLTADWIRRARLLAISLYRPKQDNTVWDSLIPVKVAERKDREQNDWFIYTSDTQGKDYHPKLGLVPSGTLNIWIG
jgi:CRISPR-associated helicase Cas3/CRISPR-associated endonuclease Cas3-HD